MEHQNLDSSPVLQVLVLVVDLDLFLVTVSELAEVVIRHAVDIETSRASIMKTEKKIGWKVWLVSGGCKLAEGVLNEIAGFWG